MKRAHVLPLLALLLAACSPSPPDITVESPKIPPRDGGTATPAPTPPGDAYVYVAKRAHGTIGLAEARKMTDEEARSLVERVADDLEACSKRLEALGTLVEGAARIVAVADASGTPALNVKLAPGGPVAQNALLCLVAPVRALPFPKNAGMAIEATWGPTK